MDEPGKTGSESQESDELGPPGPEKDFKSSVTALKCTTPVLSPVLPTTTKGVENAKKRLRAFSIQKKTPLTTTIPKTVSTGNTTVLIGKLTGAKILPKPEKLEDDPKRPQKPPKPAKPCTYRMPESYPLIQQKTMAEIEDMKRKMELVELGIPLGLICPSGTDAALPTKAMPTKAMPPIKALLDPAKVDELIREAKKAKAEGKKFKFNYRKLLPEYENPFQTKKMQDKEREKEREDEREDERENEDVKWKGERDRRIDRYDRKKRDDKYKDRSNERGRDDKERDSKYRKNDRSRDKVDNKKDEVRKNEINQEKKRNEKLDESQNELPTEERVITETDVNLNDYLVCDSWSLDTDDKTCSPHVDEKNKPTPRTSKSKDPVDILRDNLKANVDEKIIDSPQGKKIVRLQPVTDSFKFDIDDEDDEVDIFDKDSKLNKYSKQTKQQHYDSPVRFNFDGKDENDEMFLESVINEIKHEVMSEDSQDKGLVEYDSPTKEDNKKERDSVTPEIDDRIRDIQSQRSDYSDSYRSESGRKSVDSFKSSESGYKTESYRDRAERAESFRVSMEKDMDINNKMSRSTVDSLETWSFVLKICQPLLFRHDKNKCYKETRTCPKLWYTENPKLCDCVKDRSVVYEELEMCKMSLVDRVYASDQLTESPPPLARFWYPPQGDPALEFKSDTQHSSQRDTNTPEREDGSLDMEYQRFMQAVWPEVSENRQKMQAEVSRSTTPVRQERKKKAEEDIVEDKEERKRMKMSSEGWSQESDVEEEVQVVKKRKEKVRKRKRSSSTMSSLTDSDEVPKKKGKKIKKKISKKSKAKAKRRRLGKKLLLKLKEKQKKKKHKEDSDLDEEEDKEGRKKDKKLKKKKQLKQKKKADKKKKSKKSSSSSSSSTSTSESESDSEEDKRRRKKKAEKKKQKKKKRKQSTSESTQSEELFDVNILNNIKTERLTDDEKAYKSLAPDSPKPKPREIINVKQLHDDFSNNIQVKKEIERDRRVEERSEVTPEEHCEEDNNDKCDEETIEETKVPEAPQPVQKPVVLETPKCSPPKCSPPKCSPPKCSPPKCSPPKCSPPKCSPPKCSPPKCSPPKSSPPPPKPDKPQEIQPILQESNRFSPEASENGYSKHGEEKFGEFEGNYEMYEQMAMAYQSDVASQQASPLSGHAAQRIETVVGARRGHIQCDWRLSDPRPAAGGVARPSRWGLKPGEVNIVLTGGGDPSPSRQVFHIETISNSNRTESGTDYDEAYMDMYGASDLLQYGDCFSSPAPAPAPSPASAPAPASASAPSPAPDDNTAAAASDVTTSAAQRSSLDARIDKVLQDAVLGEVDKGKEKGKTVTKSGKPAKRVSFADGYKPGQDSDVEEPPVKKRPVVAGCAWPCPASHPAHVPLWDCLPPPPPPPGSPPPPRAPHSPHYRLMPHRPHRHRREALLQPIHPIIKIDPSLPFMPPEPPPGLLAFP